MNSELQNKLLNLDVVPPSGVWGKIAASLDENVWEASSQKLVQFEEIPPETVWYKITQQLDVSVPEDSKIVSIKRNFRRTLAFVAAAVLLIVAGVTATFLINRKSEPQLPAQNIDTGAYRKPDSLKPSVNAERHSSIKNANNLPTPRKQDPIASGTKPGRKRGTTMEPDAPMVESYLPRSAARKDFAASSFAADKYMIYSDDDGNAVRLPKKIFAAYVCPDESDACKQRLQQLREKFAESAVTADFTGLLEILKSLQENQ